MIIASSYFCDVANEGDTRSAPRHYFPDLSGPDVPIGRHIPEAGAVIYGGGAIARALPGLVEINRPAVQIAWGVGFSQRNAGDLPSPPRGFALYGSRDHGQPGATWTPCASCMHPLFDAVPDARHEAVAFFNSDPRISPPQIDGLPLLRNDSPIHEIVAHLASGETVVTNSYHGAYWATLLGRKVVVCGAYSSKFFHFRHPPAIADGADWRGARPVAYPEALAECRAATVAFHGAVKECLAA